MATKKRVEKRNTLQKAQEEVRELLEKQRAGTLDKQELVAGLKEIQKYLEAMSFYIFKP
jgi:signal transduction histidine kinase